MTARLPRLLLSAVLCLLTACSALRGPAAPTAAEAAAPVPVVAAEAAGEPEAAPPPALPEPPAAVPMLLTPAQRSALQLHVMTGELAAGRRQPQLAVDEFLKALAIANDAELAQRTTSLALGLRNETLALKAAQYWQQAAPNEADPREVIARLALNRGDVEEVYRQCEALAGGHAGGPEDGLRQVAQILSLAGAAQADAALQVMQRLVTRWPQLAPSHHALALLALRYNKLDVADAAAQRAAELAPQEREHRLLLAGVRVRQERLDEADAIMEPLAQSADRPSELRLGYAKLLLETGARDRARAQLTLLLQKDPGNADARYAVAVLDFNDRRHDEAVRGFESLLSGPRASDAAYQLGRIAEQRKDYPAALAFYARAGTGAQALDAAVRSAGLLARSGDIRQAQQQMQQLRAAYPPLAERFYLAEAEILDDAGQTAQALAVYESALRQLPDSEDLLYGRSLAHEKLERYDLAESDLRRLIERNPDDARAMNALGYMLTVRTRRYEEAQKLIARAHELEPEDAAILDSLGWVRFKLGDRDGARALLQRAYDKLPDGEIAAHLGEVLWTLGDREQARRIWQQALENEPDHAVLKETLKRHPQ